MKLLGVLIHEDLNPKRLGIIKCETLFSFFSAIELFSTNSSRIFSLCVMVDAYPPPLNCNQN